MNRLITLIICLFPTYLSAQTPEHLRAPLRGIWIRNDKPTDTLIFILPDNNVVDLEIRNDSTNHGYFIQVEDDNMTIEAMCSGRIETVKFALNQEKKELKIGDFYNGTKEQYVFRKIHDNFWGDRAVTTTPTIKLASPDDSDILPGPGR